MLLLDAGDLLAQAFVDHRERICGRGVGGGVVDGVDGEEEILGADVVVEARGAEVFADVCLGLLKAWAMPVASGSWIGQFRAVRVRPELQQIGDAGSEADVYK